ncbi:MAG TPA: TlpA disulfide reductase family protein [Thermoanaerobaculia bacterium]
MKTSARAAAAALFFLLSSAPLAADAPRIKGEIDAKQFHDLIAREKGKVVLVNFWATWCVPCREEFPDLVRLEADWRSKGVVVIGVSTDLGKDLTAVEKFLATNDPAFANYHKKSGGDDQDFIDSVDPKWGGELPFSVLYARDGHKAAILSGKQSRADFEREIGKLLKAPAAGR